MCIPSGHAKCNNCLYVVFVNEMGMLSVCEFELKPNTTHINNKNPSKCFSISKSQKALKKLRIWRLKSSHRSNSYVHAKFKIDALLWD